MNAKTRLAVIQQIGALGLVLGLTACVSTPNSGGGGYGGGYGGTGAAAGQGLDDYVLVDCMLPGQVRQLGTRMTYLTPRRAVKTTGKDCAIRGGEYVLFDRSDYTSALQALLPKARGGDPVAQAYVGEIYEKGWGMAAPDYAKAANWYRKAAQGGHGPAQTSLGSLYERGLGVPKDKAKALDWYRKASGVTDDSLVFESKLKAERERFRKEIALRERTASSLRRKVRSTEQQLTTQSNAIKGTRSTLEKERKRLQQTAGGTGTASGAGEAAELQRRVAAQEAALAEQQRQAAALESTLQKERDLLESQKRDAKSEAEQLKKELEAVRALKSSGVGAGQKQSSVPNAKTAQLAKLELTRKEQLETAVAVSRRVAGGP